MTGRVLVTGAAGFLGRTVCRALAHAGWEPVSTDHRESPGVHAMDVTSPKDIAAVLRATPVDAVVHLAAAGAGDRGLVAGAEEDIQRAVHVNVEGLACVATAAGEHGARLVWSSSTTIYGPAGGYRGAPVGEDAPMRPTTVYGATKAACEHLTPLLRQRLRIPVTSLRLPMVYGPDRWYGGSQQPLVDLCRGLQTGRPVTVDAWTGAADWIHVEDAAAAIVALTRAEDPRPAYHVLGHRGSLAELADALLAGAGYPPSVTVRPTDGGAPDLPAIDDSVLRQEIGFTPRYADAGSGAATFLPAAAESTGHTPAPTTWTEKEDRP